MDIKRFAYKLKTMDLTNKEDLLVAMRLAGIKPKKGLGQHFLVDRDALMAIIKAADIQPDDVVLEIGPGLGVMTTLLVKQAKRVVAVEADETLAALLARDHPANLVVASDDIMQFDLSQVGSPYKVVANLPYYITSKILRMLLESATPPTRLSVLVQKEVAERIVAQPGAMSLLSLSVQYYAEARIEGVVERYKFWPAPEVDSAILALNLRSQPLFEADTAALFRLMKAGFGEKRKQLKNSLAGGLNTSVDFAVALLAAAKINPMARAQELSLKDWQRLYQQAVREGILL